MKSYKDIILNPTSTIKETIIKIINNDIKLVDSKEIL